MGTPFGEHAFQEANSVLDYFEASILPAQFYPNLSAETNTFEKRLFYAVLEDAVCVLLKNVIREGRRAKRLFRETQEWFFSPDAQCTFSFIVICDHLGLEPGYILRGLKEVMAKMIAEKARGSVIKFRKPKIRKGIRTQNTVTSRSHKFISKLPKVA